MFVFGSAMLKCEGYSDKSEFFDRNGRAGLCCQLLSSLTRRVVITRQHLTLPRADQPLRKIQFAGGSQDELQASEVVQF